MSDRVRLLQLANVGRVTGGTGACVWTVTRALPDWDHCVLFFSPPDGETRAAFGPANLFTADRLMQSLLDDCRPDLVLLHNTSPRRIVPGIALPPAVSYCHSKTQVVPAGRTVSCSRFLQDQTNDDSADSVLYQAVPRPVRDVDADESRALRDDLIVGRLCTPSLRKWPDELIGFYEFLAERHPAVQWEFVGCPEHLQDRLRNAVGKRIVFHPASVSARSHFWRWDALLYHHPSLPETFGRTVAEAMRAGCISVVDDRGGFREQITSETGFLCSTLEEFSAALSGLRDLAARRTRSRSCRAHADERFSIARFREDLLGVFRQVMER